MKMPANGPSIVLVLLFSLPLFGQETTGSIAGTIRDQSGGVIRQAAISITNQQTGQSIKAISDSFGVYSVPELRPGRYAIELQATGFARGEAKDVVVLLGRTVHVDVKMVVSRIEQTITAISTPIIDLSTTVVSLNIQSDEFDHLPKARSLRDMAVLQTSVTAGPIEGGFQVNGASGAENNFYIDGVSTTSVIDGSARQDALPEYVQEFQVKTAGLEAEYGGALGGVISAVTKSGGNNFHGELHYYYSGNRLSAGPAKRLQLDPEGTVNPSAAYIQDEKQKRDSHEVGFTLSGPFIKARLWFFSSFAPQWQRASNVYHFDSGETQDTLKSSMNRMNWFNKVTWDPAQRIRTGFTWLYTPAHMTGSLPIYNAMQPNTSTIDPANAQGYKQSGFDQPEQSYSASVDLTLSHTSVLSVKGGRCYLNYKENGIPSVKSYSWQSSSLGMDIPEGLQKPYSYSTPSAARIIHDITTRTYVQADFSKFVSFFGQHNFKLGAGAQKNVNNVNDNKVGALGRVQLFWDLSFNGDKGEYGYYAVDDAGTIGSAGATIAHLYIQDSWRIHPRLTINAGLRMEREVIPAFQRAEAKEELGTEYAFKFGFADKPAPRLGASLDVLGNGKVKVYGAWGRYFDWTKYALARRAFGGEIWRRYYRSLDTLDIYNIDLTNMPGRNLLPTGEYRNLRMPGFKYLDPHVEPMSADVMNFGVDYEYRPQFVFSARFTRNHLNRTIEDMSVLDENGSAAYRFGNPGEGANRMAPASGQTCVIQLENGACGFPMPKAERVYSALELSISRRFSSGWQANVSYVYSDLWGNYSGLQSTDEILPPALGYSAPHAQDFTASTYRSGANNNFYFDLDEVMWDAHGKAGVFGPLPTDRPHVFKFYGSKQFSFGTEIGAYFRIMSGTPVTTRVTTVNRIPVFVEGRGNLGRTPVFSQTDLLVAHEFKIGESQKVRLELNMANLFNQKTSLFTFDRYNREDLPDSAGINLINTDLSKGFDWREMVLATDAGTHALDPRYKKGDMFNGGFSGRFLVKYIF